VPKPEERRTVALPDLSIITEGINGMDTATGIHQLLIDPDAQLRLTELKDLGFPVVQFSTIGGTALVTASGYIDGRTVTVKGESPTSSFRNALHLIMDNARNLAGQIAAGSAPDHRGMAWMNPDMSRPGR
jgi:hypothetical protein